MDGNKTVTAGSASDPPGLTLTISSTAGGSIISPGKGTFQCSHGDQVVLQAEADPLFAMPGYWASSADLTKVLLASDPTAIWVPGDYPLRSQAGRWDQLGEKWVTDVLTSPCIDAGDPASPVGAEPQPNGNRINMGAYGGTSQASLSTE